MGWLLEKSEIIGHPGRQGLLDGALSSLEGLGQERGHAGEGIRTELEGQATVSFLEVQGKCSEQKELPRPRSRQLLLPWSAAQRGTVPRLRSHGEPQRAVLSHLCLSFPTWGWEL